MCEHGTEECPELTVCDGCLKDAKIKRLEAASKPMEEKSCHCIYHPETELVHGLCNKCQYGPRSERTCRGCRWHWSAPSGDGSAGTADHKCLAVDQSDGLWHFGALPMQGAKFIDELNHTQYPPAPSWCPCVQIPVTEEQVEFAEHLPVIQCDREYMDLMRQNVLLRAEVSQLKACQKGNSKEYYAEIRRFHAVVDKEDGLQEGKLVTIELTPLAAQEVDRLCLVYGLTIAELFRQALALVRDANFAPKKKAFRLDEDTGNEEGSGIPSQTMPAGVQCTSCGKLTSNDGACTQCGAAQKVRIPAEEGYGDSIIGGAEVALLKENAALRSKVSQLELALDEIYCSVRRAKPAPECPTDWNIAVRHHNDKVSALQEAQNLNDRNKALEFECKRECERLEKIIADGNAECVRLRNIIAEDNIKPRVTGQGKATKG